MKKTMLFIILVTGIANGTFAADNKQNQEASCPPSNQQQYWMVAYGRAFLNSSNAKTLQATNILLSGAKEMWDGLKSDGLLDDINVEKEAQETVSVVLGAGSQAVQDRLNTLNPADSPTPPDLD